MVDFHSLKILSEDLAAEQARLPQSIDANHYSSRFNRPTLERLGLLWDARKVFRE